ncbi:MAG: molybdate ABC transporter substrate-binding protein [Candidatus Zipacnadales bacterium]
MKRIVYLVYLSALTLLPIMVFSGCPKRPSQEAMESAGNITATPPPAEEVRVLSIYIPCGLTVPIREAIAKFEAANPGVKLEGRFDNAITNALAIIDKGERPSLFVSPGRRELELLEEKGLIAEDTKTAIGCFELVVATPKDNPKNIHSLEDLTKADVITMPDPERNSIGVYGKQALEKAGLWEKLMAKGDEKIVLTQFPISAYEKIATGKSDAALMFRNCPLETDPEKLAASSIAIVADVDKSLYDQPLCFIAALKEAPHLDLAKQFIAFLIEPDTQKLLGENGMQLLDAKALAAVNKTDPESSVPITEVSKPSDLKLPIKVEAYYPDNEGHAYLKKMIEDLPKRYGNDVIAEFIDFTSDEGYVRWHDYRGMSCGGILLNGRQVFLVERKGQSREVTFTMGDESGEWTKEDLYWVLDQATGKKTQ